MIEMHTRLFESDFDGRRVLCLNAGLPCHTMRIGGTTSSQAKRVERTAKSCDQCHLQCPSMASMAMSLHISSRPLNVSFQSPHDQACSCSDHHHVYFWQGLAAGAGLYQRHPSYLASWIVARVTPREEIWMPTLRGDLNCNSGQHSNAISVRDVIEAHKGP